MLVEIIAESKSRLARRSLGGFCALTVQDALTGKSVQSVDRFASSCPLCRGGENIRSIAVVQYSESTYNFVSSRLCGENHFHSPGSQLPTSSPSGGYGLASYAMNSLGITNNTAQIFNSGPSLQPMSSGVFNANLQQQVAEGQNASWAGMYTNTINSMFTTTPAALGGSLAKAITLGRYPNVNEVYTQSWQNTLVSGTWVQTATNAALSTSVGSVAAAGGLMGVSALGSVADITSFTQLANTAYLNAPYLAIMGGTALSAMNYYPGPAPEIAAASMVSQETQTLYDNSAAINAWENEGGTLTNNMPVTECGSIYYGVPDELGRPTGVNATITQDMIGTGTPANPEIIPPGWSGNGTIFNEARGHLLGAQLGGSGDVAENLVTLQQNPANSPIMRAFETSIRNAVEGGEVVNYSSTPMYNGSNLVPRGITLYGHGSSGFNLNVTILNPRGF